MKDKMPLKAWAIAHRKTGKLVIFDARVPVFWNRRVARLAAGEHGFLDAYGRNSEYEIKRVTVASETPR